MDKVARLPAERRRELFSETAAKKGLLAGLIEKDFWVCWILKRLFSAPAFRTHLLFKGGTTLSKIFGVIRRFSEDIDLAVDWDMLGFVGEKSPLADMSTTKRNALLAEMHDACREYIATDFVATLRNQIREELPDTDSSKVVQQDQDNRDVVNFLYPATTEQMDYVQPAVRLELGTHAELIPSERYSIRPYAADHFEHIFEDAACSVQAITAERRFWEKATILHQEHYRTSERGAPTRLSRHYYDVFMMAANHGILEEALRSRALLARVVEHKKRFYPERGPDTTSRRQPHSSSFHPPIGPTSCAETTRP